MTILSIVWTIGILLLVAYTVISYWRLHREIDGTCVRSAPVVMTQHVDSIDITMRERRENGVSVGTDIQIETNLYGGSLLTYFAHPEN